MAKKLKTDTGIEKVENVLGKTEEYIQNNKKFDCNYISDSFNNFRLRFI